MKRQHNGDTWVMALLGINNCVIINKKEVLMRKCKCGGIYKLFATTTYHKCNRTIKIYVCNKCKKDLKVEVK